MPKTHKSGFGNGAIIEFDDGSAAYRTGGMLGQAFRVRIADVTGFSVSNDGKILERTLHVLGNGTEIARTSVSHGVAERIEAWFRAHPQFGAHAAPGQAAQVTPTAAGRGLVDELARLGELHASGVITQGEFEAAKRKLLA